MSREEIKMSVSQTVMVAFAIRPQGFGASAELGRQAHRDMEGMAIRVRPQTLPGFELNKREGVFPVKEKPMSRILPGGVMLTGQPDVTYYSADGLRVIEVEEIKPGKKDPHYLQAWLSGVLAGAEWATLMCWKRPARVSFRIEAGDAETAGMLVRGTYYLDRGQGQIEAARERRRVKGRQKSFGGRGLKPGRGEEGMAVFVTQGQELREVRGIPPELRKLGMADVLEEPKGRIEQIKRDQVRYRKQVDAMKRGTIRMIKRRFV